MAAPYQKDQPLPPKKISSLFALLDARLSAIEHNTYYHAPSPMTYPQELSVLVGTTDNPISQTPLKIHSGIIQNNATHVVGIRIANGPAKGYNLKAGAVADDGTGGTLVVGPVDLSYFFLDGTSGDRVSVYYEQVIPSTEEPTH